MNQTPTPSQVRAAIAVERIPPSENSTDVPEVDASPRQTTANITLDPRSHGCLIRDQDVWQQMGTTLAMRVVVTDTGSVEVLDVQSATATASYVEFATCVFETFWEFRPATTDGIPQYSDNLVVRITLTRGN